MFVVQGQTEYKGGTSRADHREKQRLVNELCGILGLFNRLSPKWERDVPRVLRELHRQQGEWTKIERRVTGKSI